MILLQCKIFYHAVVLLLHIGYLLLPKKTLTSVSVHVPLIRNTSKTLSQQLQCQLYVSNWPINRPFGCPRATVEPLYKGQVGGRSFVPYTVEPLYKGQVGGRSFVPYTVEPLYKGPVGGRSFVPYTVEPLYKGQVGGRSFQCPLYSGASLQGTSWGQVHWRENVLFSEVTYVLSL